MQVYTRDQHNISRKNISKNALKVLYRLNQAGYQAYVVGGAVRDLLRGKSPKDFDVTTNATPEQIKGLFKNCRLIGRRFRLAHIVFGREIIEVATFRGHHDEKGQDKQVSSQSKNGRLLRDNVYGTTIDEDAERRDFTINAMYYDISDYSIRDYAGGVTDLNKGLLRLIGDPETRYSEDPVRMLRAIRFAAKLGMQIEEKTASAIPRLAHLLKDIPPARIYDESSKLFQSGYAIETFLQMRSYDLFEPIFPYVSRFLDAEHNSQTEQFIFQAFHSTDKRIQDGKRINPAFIFATMLWYPTLAKAKELKAEHKMSDYDAFSAAADTIMREQVRTIAIPRRFTAIIREIWLMQFRLSRRSGKRAFRLLEQNKFRASFDFLEMRAAVEGGPLKELAQWWAVFQKKDNETRHLMVQSLNNATPKKRLKKPRRRPQSKTTQEAE